MSEVYCVVYISVDSESAAATLAQALVQDRLAACVQSVGPVRSTYLWQGELKQDNEYLLIAKTRQARLEALTARVKALHSYDVPEIIALPIIGGLPAYLDWVQHETQES